MTTVHSSVQTPTNPRTQVHDFTPPSKEATYFSTIWNGASSICSFFTDQTTPSNTLDPERVSLPDQDPSPSFLSSIKRGLLNTTTTQRVAAVSILALGYAYYQAPSTNEVVDRLALQLMEHSSLQPQVSPQSAPLPSRDWSQNVPLILSSVAIIQNTFLFSRQDLSLDLIRQSRQSLETLLGHVRPLSKVNLEGLFNNLIENINSNNLLIASTIAKNNHPQFKLETPSKY